MVGNRLGYPTSVLRSGGMCAVIGNGWGIQPLCSAPGVCVP